MPDIISISSATPGRGFSRRRSFYAVIQDLLNLGLLREKPDDSYGLDSLLGSAYGAEASDGKRERAAARREDMKRRNLIEIMNIEVTQLAEAFLDYTSDPQEGARTAGAGALSSSPGCGGRL
jgi:hypothetical protein